MRNRFIQLCGAMLVAAMNICPGHQGAADRCLDAYIERSMQAYPQDSYWNEREAEAMNACVNAWKMGSEMGEAELRWSCIRSFRSRQLKDEEGLPDKGKKLLMHEVLQGVDVQQADSGQWQIKCGSKSYIVLPVAWRTLERAGLAYLRELCELYRCAWDMGSPKERQRDLHRDVWQTLCLKDNVAFFGGDGLTLIDGPIYVHYDKDKGTYAGWDIEPETRLAHYRCSEGERAALEHALSACPRVTAPAAELPAHHGECDADSGDDDVMPLEEDDDVWDVDIDHLNYIDDKEKTLISRLDPKMKERLEKEGKLLRSEYDKEMQRYEPDELTLEQKRTPISGQPVASLRYRGKIYRVMPLDTDTAGGTDYKHLYEQCLLFNCACGVRKPLPEDSATHQGEKVFIKVDRRLALYHQGYLTLIDGPSYFYYDKETGMYVGRETGGGGVTRYQCNERERRQLEKFVRMARKWGKFTRIIAACI